MMRGLRLVALVVLSCGCGADVVPGQSHTVDGSLWSSFSAQVTETSRAMAQVTSVDDAAGSSAPLVEVWSVTQAGVAQYASTISNLESVDGVARPQVVAVRKLDGPALVALQNALARTRVFAWDSTITCDAVICSKNPGRAVLEVDLNGRRKTITWPLYAEGLPDGLEEMAQTIKDASSAG